MTREATSEILFLMILVILMFSSFGYLTPEASTFSPTQLSIRPPENVFYANQTPPGSIFTINITISNVVNLFCWQIKVKWNPDILNFSSVILPSDHVFAGQSFILAGPITSVAGQVVLGCSLSWGGIAFTGNGTLCQLRLKILRQSSEPIHVEIIFFGLPFDTFLLDNNGLEIPFDIENATFTYYPSSTRLMILPKANIMYGNVTPPGSTFVINITVADVVRLYSWQFEIEWNQTILEYVNVILPSDHMFVGQSIVQAGPLVEPNSVVYGVSLGVGGIGVNGTGTLCQLELKILVPTNPASVASNLTFVGIGPDTFLLNDIGLDILFEAEDGVFTYLPPLPDVAALNVIPSAPNVNLSNPIPLKDVIGKGYATIIYGIIENQGVYLEHNIQVYVYWSNGTHFNQTIDTVMIPELEVNMSEVFSIHWYTNGLVYGNYTISAYASPVPYETNMTNNLYIAVAVHLGVPGDVSSSTVGVYDGVCNMRDINYLVMHFNTGSNSPNWKPNTDVDNDGVCNMRDINIAIRNFNQHE